MQKSLDEIISEFDPTSEANRIRIKDGEPVTIWLLRGDKARYDRLQKISGRRFNVKLRELIVAALDAAEARAMG